MANQSVSIKDAVHKLQIFLLDGIRTENQLFAAGSLMSKSDYDDVVVERSISKLCGNPLCIKPLPSQRTRKGRYRISLKEHKVYDLQETYVYCCSACLVRSSTFRNSLKEERCSVSNQAKLDEILRLFTHLDVDAEAGLGKEEDLGFSRLRIHEKSGCGAGEVSIEDWIGPANAIEGYVLPRNPPNNKNRKKVEQMLMEEVEFASVLTQEEYTISKTSGICAAVLSMQPDGSKIEITQTVNEDKSMTLSSSSLQNREFRSSTTDSSSCEHISDGNSMRTASGVANIQNSSEVLPSFSIKSSNVKKPSRSVTWADEGADGMKRGDLCEVQEIESIVSEVGISIDGLQTTIPPSKLQMRDEDFYPDIFDSENSLLDMPPEGFNLTLSPFATTWTTLFSWITSSTLAYVYGRDEASHEDFMSVKGREYPRKIVLPDGRSLEIQKTLATCLARALPTLVTHLKLSTPVSYLEKGLSSLLDTMSFMDALPSLRSKQWQVITLLFIEALSIFRIPSLASQLEKGLPLGKVLDGSQIQIKEYECMKDLMLPLAQYSHISSQNGGWLHA